MEYTKRFIGKATQWACFTKDNDSQLLSVASKDGLISIYSPDNRLIYACKDDNFNLAYLLHAKDCLFGVCYSGGLHVWRMKENRESFDYKFYKLDLDDGASISCTLHCHHLGTDDQFRTISPILVGDNKGNLQISFIKEETIVKSNRINLFNNAFKSNEKIDQILEISYENRISLIVVLIHNQLFKVKCQIECESDDNSDITSIDLAMIQMISITCTEIDIVHMEPLWDGRLMVCTYSGRYQIVPCIGVQSDSGDTIEADAIFPYGPFPCRKIDKCIVSHLNGIKGQCCIFSGGMPATTYRHLNTVSVSIDNEPEICFTFDDVVIDFKVIPHGLQDFDEIMVLTRTELISISYQNGMWISKTHNQLSPFSKNEVTRISNIVEIPNENESRLPNGYTEHIPKNSMIQIFAVSHTDNTVSIWCLSSNRYLLIEKLDLYRFYITSTVQESMKRVLWPRFQKCGTWKKSVNEEINIDLMKFVQDSNGSIFLLVSTNGTSIFLFKVHCQLNDDEENEEACEDCNDKVSSHHYISIGDSDAIDNDKINNVGKIYSNYVKLVASVTFSSCLETYTIDYNNDNNMLSFAGVGGTGFLDLSSGKHIFLQSSTLEQVERMKSGSHLLKLLQKPFHKRKSNGSPLLKTETGIDVRTKSMFLWQPKDKSFHLILGFNNGSIVVVEFDVDTSGNFVIENKFKTCNTNTNLDIIDLRIMEMKSDAMSVSKYATLDSSSNIKKNNLEDTDSIDQKVDPSGDGCVSLEIKSSGTTNASSNSNDGASIQSKKSKSSLFQRLSKSGKERKSKTFLLRCDSQSLKIIDYSKMKTKFKFKINEFYDFESESTISRRKTNPLSTIPQIAQSRTLRNDHSSNEWQCWLLLTNHDMLELHLPTLCPLRKININERELGHNLIAIYRNLIILVENKYGSSQLMVLSEHQYETYKMIEKDERLPSNIPVDLIEDGTNQMDFMKEAKISLNSLLW